MSVANEIATATAFLKALLGSGPVPVSEVQRRSEESGIGWRTLRRASDAMQICKRPNADDRRWHWSLPTDDANLSSFDSAPAQDQRKRTAARAPKPADVLKQWQEFLQTRQVEFPPRAAEPGKGRSRHDQGNASAMPRHNQLGAPRRDGAEQEKSNADTAT